MDPVVRTTVEPETFEVPVTVMVAVDLTRMAEAVETIAVELPLMTTSLFVPRSTVSPPADETRAMAPVVAPAICIRSR